MSVFVIYMVGGRKMMRPVRSREEYLALRNSGLNRAADKQHMVQMNYSCLPNEDGSLKGSKRMSNTIGADIDLNENDNENEKQTHAVRDLILAKKEELGLLMLEESATKGYHVVCRRAPGLNQEENLVRISSILGVPYDKGAKDITRVFYTSADKLIFIEDEIFNTPSQPPRGEEMEKIGGVDNPGPNMSSLQDSGVLGHPETQGLHPALGYATPSELSAVGTAENSVGCQPYGEGTAEHSVGCQPYGEGAGEKVYSLPSPCKGEGLGMGAVVLGASPQSLKAFDLCVENAGLKVGEMDVWGEHNWHSNLMAVLSIGLPKLMSKEQLLAVIKEKLPNYSQTEDCKKLIAYFYDKYVADKGFMSTTLRDINAKAQAFANIKDQGSSEDDEDKNIDALSEGWTPPVLPKKIPRLMELLVNNYDPRFRDMLLMSSLPVLSAHASHFRAIYLNGSVIGPQQYVSVIGGSGQGKGNCTSLFQEMVQYTLQDNDDREWVKVKENAELRDKKANAKERPPKYHPKLRLFETTSKSSILELQSNLGKNGMLLGQFSEVDGLSSASRAAYSDISVLLRKGWDMDMHRQFYMSDATCNTYTRMSISLLMAGTVKAMLVRMFSDNNCEGGLMQRCIPVLVPKTKRTFRPPRRNFLSDDEKKERDALLIELYQKDLALGEDTLILETPMMTKAIGDWYDELEERYSNGELTDAESDLSHRCGEFMMRAAIPLIALYGKETKEIVDFCRWVGETAHYTMCRIFGLRVQNDLIAAKEMLAVRLDSRKTAEPLLDKLPFIFTVQQLKEVREKEGQSTEVRMLLSRLCKSKKIERIERGVYRKILPTPDSSLNEM